MSKESFFSKINSVFEKVDDKIGPSSLKYKPACDEDKEMFLECVMSSPCYQNSKNFKYCAQDGVSK